MNVGSSSSGNFVTINNCYNFANVSDGSVDVGGIIGRVLGTAKY